MVAGVAEEGVEGDAVDLLGADHQVGDRHHDVVELGTHGVFQLQTAAAFGQLHALVVGQVDGDGLGARIAVAGVVDHIVDIDVAVGARHLLFIFLVAGQELLHFGEHGGELAEVVAPLLVLHQHECFVAAFQAVDAVVVVLDGAHDKVKLAVFHVHPHHIALEVVVGAEGLAAGFEVLLQALVLSQIDGFGQQFVHFLQLFGICLVVGQDIEFALFVAADDAVLAVFQRVLQSRKLLGGHVLRIEVATLQPAGRSP